MFHAKMVALEKRATDDLRAVHYLEHNKMTLAERELMLTDHRLHVFRNVHMPHKPPTDSTNRATAALGNLHRLVWMDSTEDPGAGWRDNDFPSTSILKLFLQKPLPRPRAHIQEFDKFLVQGDGSVSGVHTDFCRQLVLSYPQVTRGWVRVWVFWPSIDDPAIKTRIIINDLAQNDPNCARRRNDGAARDVFFKLSLLPYVTVIFTYPGDVLYIPIGRMHTVMSCKWPRETNCSKLCVSGGVHLVLAEDLERSRYVVRNNPRIGFRQETLLKVIAHYANHFKVLEPKSRHHSRKRKHACAAAAARARQGRARARSNEENKNESGSALVPLLPHGRDKEWREPRATKKKKTKR